MLFARKGYADTSIGEVARRARVTKGALYHHFATKLELYRVVVEDLEHELLVRIEAAAAGQGDPWERLRAMCRAYLDACRDAAVGRILVLEAPVVLGWKAWCDIAHEGEVAAFTRCLRDAVAAGLVREHSVETMAQVILGALNTAARVVATAADPAAAGAQVEETLERLLGGFRAFVEGG